MNVTFLIGNGFDFFQLEGFTSGNSQSEFLPLSQTGINFYDHQ